jgi:hypothetical protein
MNETSIPRQRPVLKPTIILAENNMNANIKAKIYALHNTLLSFSIQENDKANGGVNTNYPKTDMAENNQGTCSACKMFIK